MSPRPGRGALLLLVTAAVAVAMVAGFLALGSPQDERRRRLDEVRVHDLMALRSAVAGHFERTGTLPPALAALDPRPSKPSATDDPAGRGPYGYAVLTDSSFQLCATFDEASRAEAGRFAYDPWFHAAGPQCYRFRIGRVDGREPRLDLLPLREDEPGPPR
ncbi:MAG: hypothetical protein ABIP29_03570 [Candidatus Eisenbacteria bacterium]